MKLFSYTQLTKNEQDAMNGFKMALNVLDPTIYRIHIDIDTKEVNVLRVKAVEGVGKRIDEQTYWVVKDTT